MSMQKSSGNKPWRFGFTLIELMVVVAVVALLTAIAYPAYLDQVRKARRAEGKVVILQTVQNIERFYTLNNNYASSVTSVVGASGVLSEHGFYTVTSTASDATSYTLAAAPRLGQGSDRCQTLIINQTGAKSTSNGLSVTECW